MAVAAMAEARVRSLSVGRTQHRGLRVNYQEQYPEMSKKTERSRSDDRWKTLNNLFENITETDEESAGTSDCSTSSLSLEGRSPYALPVEDRSCYFTPRYQSSLIVHPLISPKISRRSHTSISHLQRGFSEPIMRQRRSPMSTIDRRAGGSCEQLTVDFFNLPPIPESVPLRIRGDKATKYEEDEETDNDDSSECSDLNSST